MDPRRPPIAARLAATAASLALLVGCTTSSGEDADARDPTTMALASGAPIWKRQVLDGPKISRNRSRVDDGELLAGGTEQAWMLSGAIDTLQATKPVVWQSPDRTAWSRQDLPGGHTDVANVELAVGDGKGLAVGRDEAPGGTTAPVWLLQKHRWKTVDADLPDDARVTVAIRAAKAWFVLGSLQAKDGSTRDAVWRSSDAKTWKRVFTVPEGGDLKTLGGLTDVAVGGTLGTGDEQRSVIWHAKQGTTWSKPASLPAVPFGSTTEARDTTDAVVSSLAQGTQGWKAVGSATDKGRIQPVTWTSNDGATWQPEVAIPPYLEEARGASVRRAQRVVWDGGSFLAYGGSDYAHETWLYEPISGYWVDAAVPSTFKRTEGRGAFTALVGDGQGNLLLAGEADRQIRVWANGRGGFDNEVTDAKVMPTDAAYSDTHDLQVRGRKVVVVGRLDDGEVRPLLWTGTDVDKLGRATGSDALSGRVDIATVEDRQVVVWGSAKDNSLTAWKSPVAAPALAPAPDVVAAIGATSTEAGVTSVHASFDVGGQTFVAGVDPQGPRALPTVWALQGGAFTRQALPPEGEEAVQVFTGGCGGTKHGLAYGVAYGPGASDDDQPIAAVIAKGGGVTSVERAQLQPEATTATIVTCAVAGDDLVLGGSLARKGKPARPATWTSKDGTRWKIDDDLDTVAEGRVFRLAGSGRGVAAIIKDRNDVSSVWRTDKGGDWARWSKPGTFGGSTVYVNGLVTTADGRLVVAGASRNQATLWTLPADAGS